MEGDISRGLGSGIMADQVFRSSYASVNYLTIPPGTFLFPPDRAIGLCVIRQADGMLRRPVDRRISFKYS